MWLNFFKKKSHDCQLATMNHFFFFYILIFINSLFPLLLFHWIVLDCERSEKAIGFTKMCFFILLT